MRSILTALAVLFLSVASINGAPSEATDREAFNRKMYSVAPMHNFGNLGQYASLGDHQKQDLLACHDVLVALFRRLDAKGDFSPYLTPEMRKKYRTWADFVDPETELEEVGVLDWTFLNSNSEIQLNFLVVVYSEGDWVLSKNEASFKKSGPGWQIDNLELNENQSINPSPDAPPNGQVRQ